MLIQVFQVSICCKSTYNGDGMLRMEKILVPVDFSAASVVALQYAGAVARSFGSFITLLHARGTADEPRQKLDALGRAEFGSLPFSTVLKPGDPARVIVDQARSGRFGLIVMSTHGYGPFCRLLL